MRIGLTRLVITGMSFFPATLLYASSLTPPHEPHDNSFYVCYKQCHIKRSLYAPLAVYHKYQYRGCMISRKPCTTMVLRKKHCSIPVVTMPTCKSCATAKPCATILRKQVSCPPITMKSFGWFDTYPQALNAFYRCAYS